MKRIIFALLLLGFALNSCKKERSKAYEVEQAHANPDELMQRFMNAIESGASAWEATLNPQSGKSYTLFFSINKTGNVQMLADLDVNTARQPKSGTYKFSVGNTSASITFSKGTYLDDVTHRKGYRTLGADTSYAFQYQKGDTLFLRGNTYGDELKMVNITAEQIIAFEQGVLGNTGIYMQRYFTKKPFFSVMTADGIPVQVGINALYRSLTLFYARQGKLVIEAVDYAYGLNRIVLKKTIRIGQLLISELKVDTETGTFYIPDGSAKLLLNGASLPVIPLHLLIGNDFPPNISLPSPIFLDGLPGWSPEFLDIWFDATVKLYESPLNCKLLVISFNLDIKRNLLNLNIFFAYLGQYYQATYPLSYTKSLDGEYKFKMLPLNPNNPAHSNALLIASYLAPLTDLIVKDSFKMDYYDTGKTILAQLTSQDRPQIYFTGYMTE